MQAQQWHAPAATGLLHSQVCHWQCCMLRTTRLNLYRCTHSICAVKSMLSLSLFLCARNSLVRQHQHNRNLGAMRLLMLHTCGSGWHHCMHGDVLATEGGVAEVNLRLSALRAGVHHLDCDRLRVCRAVGLREKQSTHQCISCILWPLLARIRHMESWIQQPADCKAHQVGQNSAQ